MNLELQKLYVERLKCNKLSLKIDKTCYIFFINLLEKVQLLNS